MKLTKDWLKDDLHIFRNHYLKCDSNERKKYKKGLLKYRNRFDNKVEFLQWYLSIVN